MPGPSKLIDLPVAAPATTDLLYVVTDPGGTPTSKRTTIGDVLALAGGGGAAIPPNSITGLTMWLKADALSLADNDPVASWTDSSGLGNHMTQATPANRPLYKTNILNGLPVLRFDSTDGLTTGPTLANPFSIFYVANNTGGSGNRRLVSSTAVNWLLGPYTGTWQWYCGSFGAALGTATSAWVVHGVVQTASAGTHFLQYVQDTLLVYPATSFMSAGLGSPLAVGTMTLGASNVFGEPHIGDVAEVIVYNTALSTPDGEGLMQYLLDKYRA